MRGKIEKFSIDTLVNMIVAAGLDIQGGFFKSAYHFWGSGCGKLIEHMNKAGRELLHNSLPTSNTTPVGPCVVKKNGNLF